MLKVDAKTLRNSILSMKALMKSKNEQSEGFFEFHPFKVDNHRYKIAAVDGSNNNINGVSMMMVALRTGYLIYQNGKLVEENISPIKMELLVNTPFEDVGYLDKYKQYFQALTGDLPKDSLEFEKAPERLRAIMEWTNIYELIEKLDGGDVVIFDGSLISGSISTSKEFYDIITTKAEEKNIALVGLSKDTSLTMNGVSIPSILKEAAKKQGFRENWYTKISMEDVENTSNKTKEELKDTYFVKFVKEKPYIYRMDVFLPNTTNFEEVLSKIGIYAFSKKNLGYPRPMQKIHDKVRISKLEKEQCFQILKKQWIRENQPKNEQEYERIRKEFEEMFYRFHDTLDVISSGR